MTRLESFNDGEKLFSVNLFHWKVESGKRSSEDDIEYTWANPFNSRRARYANLGLHPNHIFSEIKMSHPDSRFTRVSQDGKITHGISALIASVLESNNKVVTTESPYKRIVCDTQTGVVLELYFLSDVELDEITIADFKELKISMSADGKIVSQIFMHRLYANIADNEVENILVRPSYLKGILEVRDESETQTRILEHDSGARIPYKAIVQTTVNMHREILNLERKLSDNADRLSINFPKLDQPLDLMPFDESVRSSPLHSIVSDPIHQIIGVHTSNTVKGNSADDGFRTILDLNKKLKHHISLPSGICSQVEKFNWLTLSEKQVCEFNMPELVLLSTDSHSLKLKLTEKTIKWLTFDVNPSTMKMELIEKRIRPDLEGRYELTYAISGSQLDHCYYVEQTNGQTTNGIVHLVLDPTRLNVMMKFITSRDDTSSHLKPISSSIMYFDEKRTNLLLQIDSALVASDKRYNLFNSNSGHFADLSSCKTGHNEKVKVQLEYLLVSGETLQLDSSQVEGRVSDQLRNIRNQIMDKLSQLYRLSPLRVPSIKVKSVPERNIVQVDIEILERDDKSVIKMDDRITGLELMDPGKFSVHDYRELLTRSEDRYYVEDSQSCMSKCKQNSQCDLFVYCPIQGACFTFKKGFSEEKVIASDKTMINFGSYFYNGLACDGFKINMEEKDIKVGTDESWSLDDIVLDFPATIESNHEIFELELGKIDPMIRLQPSRVIQDYYNRNKKRHGQILSQQLVSDFRISKIHHRFDSDKYNYKVDKLSDCIGICQSIASSDEYCWQISFCRKQHTCSLTIGSNIANVNSSIEDDDCDIFERTSLDFFLPIRRLHLPNYRGLSKQSVISEPRVSSNIEDCAEYCFSFSGTGQDCLSFDFCESNDLESMKSICVLHNRRHISELDTNAKDQEDLANFISRNLGNSKKVKCSRTKIKLVHLYGNILTNEIENNHKSLQMSSISLDECAKRCEWDSTCSTFEYCIKSVLSSNTYGRSLLVPDSVCSIISPNYDLNNHYKQLEATNKDTLSSHNCSIYNKRNDLTDYVSEPIKNSNQDNGSFFFSMFLHLCILAASIVSSYIGRSRLCPRAQDGAKETAQGSPEPGVRNNSINQSVDLETNNVGEEAIEMQEICLNRPDEDNDNNIKSRPHIAVK